FMPQGPDKRFVDAVTSANRILILEAGGSMLLPYDVLHPAATYEKLESLVYGLLPNYRPVVIPLGPKIFAAVSIALAIRLSPQICVWRTSSGTGGEVRDAQSSGEI